MLQAWKLSEFEKMMRVKAQAEGEPEGEMLVHLGGEALSPPGMNTMISPLSLSWCIWEHPSCGNLFYIESSLATR